MTGSSANEAFSYLGVNGLYEGQLLVGLSPSQVSGQPYSVQAALSEPNWGDGSAIATLRDVGSFGAGLRTRFTDAGVGNPNPIGLTITQRSYAGGAADGAIVFVFEVTNNGPDRDGLHVGLFADFDVVTPETNLSGYDAATQTLYTYDTAGTTSNHYGLTVLSHATSGWSVTIADIGTGITDADLYTALTTPGLVPADPGDRRSVLGVGPFRLAAGATQRVAFAYIAGADRAGLLAHAAAARTAAESLADAP